MNSAKGDRTPVVPPTSNVITYGTQMLTEDDETVECSFDIKWRLMPFTCIILYIFDMIDAKYGSRVGAFPGDEAVLDLL